MTQEAQTNRWIELAAFVNDLKPTTLEPFSALLSKADMSKLRAMDGLGWFHRCVDTNRMFCPSVLSGVAA